MQSTLDCIFLVNHLRIVADHRDHPKYLIEEWVYHQEPPNIPNVLFLPSP